MNLSRSVLALLASLTVLGSTALAAPPAGVGVGVGAHGGIGIGAPPMRVPPVHVPPANVPSAPAAKGSVHANAQSSLVAGDVLHGTVTSVSGTNVTVALSNGSTQTYTVSAQTAARLQSYLNKPIAFHAQNGALALIGLGTPPLRGTLEAVNGTTAQIKLPNGTMHTYTVTAQQAEWLQAHAGKSVAFWMNANGTIELNQSTHPTKSTHRSGDSH